jgi:parvulin-like peptidyl-prolyl isomerase
LGEEMKKYLLLLFVLSFFLISCTKEKERVILQPGDKAYVLAKDLAAVVPSVDPDSQTVLIITDDFEITSDEVIKALYRNYGPRTNDLKNMNSDRVKQIIETNAEKIADQKLALFAAKGEGITISDEKVDSLLQAQYKHVGGEEVFKNYIAKNGITIEDVKEDIVKGYKVETYMNKILDEQSDFSEQDLNDRYRRLIQKDQTASVRHILLMTQGKSESEKKEVYKKAKKILSRAKSGEDFAQLAQNYSEDPGSKEKGGLYENFKRGAMVKPFEDASFSVPIGEISEIVETQYGYHIIKVMDRKKENRSFEEMRNQLENEIKKENQATIVSSHMTALKEDSNFEKISL